MLDAFEALADPNRRAILAMLRHGEQTAGTLVEGLSLSQPSVSKQLRVLREAGLVTARIDGPRRVYRINPAPLVALDRWLADYRSFWAARLDALGNHLERSD